MKNFVYISSCISRAFDLRLKKSLVISAKETIMTYKLFTRVFVLAAMLVTVFATSGTALAGGVCGGTYIVDPGDTFSKIASKCGTSVSAITSANPGVSEPLKTGQTLSVPGSNYTTPNTNATPTANVPANYNGTYIVQHGDTFSSIASRYGITVNALWAANPNIWDINYLYVGQVINVPASSSPATPATAAVPLSYGTVPAGAPKGAIALSNQAKSDVYISLHGTTNDGINFIYEYPVDGKLNVKVPSGWYDYVAWVGGVKFEGQFKLGNDGSRTIIFYANKVVVE